LKRHSAAGRNSAEKNKARPDRGAHPPGQIIGIGIDFVAVDRMAGALVRHAPLAGKLFTTYEIAFCERRYNRYESFAARFAAKEAMLKALGVGWRHGVRYSDMEIRKEPSGKPYLVIANRVKEIADELGVGRIFLTISHTRDLAVAQVVLAK
jgi:holo-[acyl-carrier protein] synthase